MAPKAKNSSKSPGARSRGSAAAPAARQARSTVAAPKAKASSSLPVAAAGKAAKEVSDAIPSESLPESPSTAAESEENVRQSAELQAQLEAQEKHKREAEAEKERLAALADGEVTVKYSMYAERFQIKGHALQTKDIDELYCLSDVMPGCFIHLADKEFAYGEDHVYIKEDPIGTCVGLLAGQTYWCYVQQDAEQERRDQERMRKVWEDGVASGIGDRDLGHERCTCCEGIMCTNEKVCLDWANRFTIAEKARRPLDAGFAT